MCVWVNLFLPPALWHPGLCLCVWLCRQKGSEWIQRCGGVFVWVFDGGVEPPRACGNPPRHLGCFRPILGVDYKDEEQHLHQKLHRRYFRLCQHLCKRKKKKSTCFWLSLQLCGVCAMHRIIIECLQLVSGWSSGIQSLGVIFSQAVLNQHKVIPAAATRGWESLFDWAGLEMSSRLNLFV